MPIRSVPDAGKRAAVILMAALLASCTTTGIIDSENPSSNRPPQWTDYAALPVIVHGQVPGLSETRLASLLPTGRPAGSAPAQAPARRVVMYVDPAALAPADSLCSREDAFQPGPQPGRYASLVGALCNTGGVVTTATARILTAGLTPAEIGGHLEMMHTQLYQALTYGNNHPDQRFPGMMYGP